MSIQRVVVTGVEAQYEMTRARDGVPIPVLALVTARAIGLEVRWECGPDVAPPIGAIYEVDLRRVDREATG